MKVLCVDVGNTNTRLGVLDAQNVVCVEKFPTRLIHEDPVNVGDRIRRMCASWTVNAASYCTVVPAVNEPLRQLLENSCSRCFNLNWQTCVGLGIDYSDPSEIGQDRLANGVGAQSKYGVPAIVIDMGTAVTLDVVSDDKGYEGGIIAPGLAVMTRYLHEKTALLPEVDLSEWNENLIQGRNTREAMAIGCVRGFRGMIEALVEPVFEDLKTRSGITPLLIAAGGDARIVGNLRFGQVIQDDAITLIGLREAFLRHLALG